MHFSNPTHPTSSISSCASTLPLQRRSTPLPPATVRTVLTSLLLLNTPRMHNNNRHCNNNNKSSRRDTNTTFHAGTLTTSPSLLSLPHVALFWWRRVSLWALCPQSHSPRHEYVIIYLWSHERCRFYRSNSNTAGTNHLILFSSLLFKSLTTTIITLFNIYRREQAAGIRNFPNVS